MESGERSGLDRILNEIELPGETEGRITEYLERSGFTDIVMKKVMIQRRMMNRALVWGIVVIFDFIVLVIMANNGSFVREYLSVYTDLAYLFFLFLSLSFLVGLFGLIYNIDTSWMKRLERKDVNGYLRNLPKRIGTRLFK